MGGSGAKSRGRTPPISVAESMGPAGARGFVEVEAHTTDGRAETMRIEVAPGHPKRELTWDEIRDKFMDCAVHGSIDASRAERAFAELMQLEACSDVGRVVDLLTLH